MGLYFPCASHTEMVYFKAMFHVDGKINLRFAHTSQSGRKDSNEDSLAIHLPAETNLVTHKGIVAAIADGVSSADAGREAAHLCTKRFMEDYYASPDIWTTKHSAKNVLTSLNRELYQQGQQYRNAEKGYVCTLSVAVFKSHTAHLFHIGDSRIYRLRGKKFEQLTTDHSVPVGPKQTYLSRAMGLDNQARVDYSTIDLQPQDLFFFSTDGIHDYIDKRRIAELLRSNTKDLNKACSMLAQEALDMNSPDNLSCIAILIESLPENSREEVSHRLTKLPFPPTLSPGNQLDGWTIIEEIHASSRSQVYLVEDNTTQRRCVMKTPSPNFIDDAGYIERFIMESWIGARISNPNVAKVIEQQRPRTALYYLTEFFAAQTLAEWAEQNHHPQLQEVRQIVQQLIKGLRAFHRKEILHQDLKPDNILIDKHGRVKIIDFGSCRISGFEEICGPIERDLILGTVDFTAPEYQLRTPSGSYSDLFSLGCITYQLLTGEHPYGSHFSKCKTLIEFNKLTYRPSYHFNPDIPLWIDGALEKAVKILPAERYEAHSQFMEDLRKPNPLFTERNRIPLAERNPLLFWKLLCALLLAICLILFMALTRK